VKVLSRQKVGILAVILPFLSPSGIFGQSESGRGFSVASIKPTSQAGRDVEGLGFVNTLPGRLVAGSARFDYIIQEAYGIKGYQLSGGPAWIHSAHYNIEAKAEGNPDGSQMLKMAQKLLEDRFQLKVHRETKELPVYILSLRRAVSRWHLHVEEIAIPTRPMTHLLLRG
jgi:uncharacterized protein (TIGR03435 family)